MERGGPEGGMSFRLRGRGAAPGGSPGLGGNPLLSISAGQASYLYEADSSVAPGTYQWYCPSELDRRIHPRTSPR